MTLKECYRILGLDQSASLDEVKHAYRRRAFELHPDLNPGLSDASRQFQRLNESYVILSKIIALREARESGKKKAAEARAPGADKSARPAESDARERPAAGAGEAKETGKARTAREAEAGRREKTSAPSGGTGGTGEPGGTAESGQERPKSGPDQTTGDSTTEAEPQAEAGGQAQEPTGAAGSARGEGAGAKTGENVYAEQQEVLKDILNDPFARRVFEDIYSEIRKKAPPRQDRAKPQSPGRRPPRPRPAVPSSLHTLGRIGLGWGQHKINLDFSKGLGGVLKDWLRSQIDEEQLFELPAKRLVPGARIRLQIRHGFSDDVTTLDVTLPPDFRLDKPIRLKGMGKKLGRWQGDLYLRFSSKD